MNHRTENGNLVIEVTPEERAELNERMAEQGFDSDETMYAVLEALVTNDAFEWIDPSVTGDLTSAPMLAILGDEQPGPDDTDDALGNGLVPVGRWDHLGKLRCMYQPVLKRYAFMSYQVTSPQRELAESGLLRVPGRSVTVHPCPLPTLPPALACRCCWGSEVLASLPTWVRTSEGRTMSKHPSSPQ